MLASLAVLLAIRYAAMVAFRRKGRTNNAVEVVRDSLRAPSLLWCLAAGLAISIDVANFTERQERLALQWIAIFVIASFTLVAAAFAVRMLRLYGEARSVPLAASGLARTITYGTVVGIGTLTLLRFLGISITPALTALGVGGLAVALALQDTLANFFAGVHLLIENPIRVGDFIRLSTGEEGIVTDIGWRTTRVLMGVNNMIVIPNTRITTSTLTNFNLPEKRMMAEVAIVAGHDADPDLVERLIAEEARLTPGVLPGEGPVVLLDPGITPTHLQFKVLVAIPERIQLGLIQSALRMRVLKRFRAEGVPFPKVEMGVQQ